MNHSSDIDVHCDRRSRESLVLTDVWSKKRVQALFIRWRVSAPHWVHSVIRYGSRENAAFSFLLLSVTSSTDTLWGVFAAQFSHCSTISFELDCGTDIVIIYFGGFGGFSILREVSKQFPTLSTR